MAEVSPSLWVGDYQILSVDRRNDTLVVAAAVTSVAEEGGSRVVANRFVVRPRIRTDTLHWRVVRDTSGDFLVCGFALEDVDLGGFGRPDNVDFEGGNIATQVAPAGGFAEERKARTDDTIAVCRCPFRFARTVELPVECAGLAGHAVPTSRTE